MKTKLSNDLEDQADLHSRSSAANQQEISRLNGLNLEMSIKVKNAERAAYQAQFDAKKAADKMAEMQKEKDFMERELMQLSEKYGVQVSHLENKLDEMRRHKSALDSRVKELQATAHFPAPVKSEPVDEPSKMPSAHAFTIAATVEQPVVEAAPMPVAQPTATKFFGTLPPFAASEDEQNSTITFSLDDDRLAEMKRRNVRILLYR